MKSITLKITKEIIKESVESDSSHCMIAQALRHIGAYSTNVTAEKAVFNLDGYRYIYPLPPKAVVQLIKFDQDKEQIRPFKFMLDGRYAFKKLIEKHPYARRRGPTKIHHAPKYKRSKRRFHGLRIIEITRGGISDPKKD